MKARSPSRYERMFLTDDLRAPDEQLDRREALDDEKDEVIHKFLMLTAVWSGLVSFLFLYCYFAA